jgi:hypothetical protein
MPTMALGCGRQQKFSATTHHDSRSKLTYLLDLFTTMRLCRVCRWLTLSLATDTIGQR